MQDITKNKFITDRFNRISIWRNRNERLSVILDQMFTLDAYYNSTKLVILVRVVAIS
jgi:hypothetical protein